MLDKSGINNLRINKLKQEIDDNVIATENLMGLMSREKYKDDFYLLKICEELMQETKELQLELDELMKQQIKHLETLISCYEQEHLFKL